MRRASGKTIALTGIEASELASLLSVSIRGLTAAAIIDEITRLKRVVARRCDAELSAMNAPAWVRGRSRKEKPCT